MSGVTPKTPQPPYPIAMTRVVAEVLGQTDYPGLTNRELEQLLPAAKLTEWEAPAANKRDKLAATLNNAQLRRKSGATLAAYLHAAMAPARYVSEPDRWEQLRDELNSALVLFGYRVSDDGRLARSARATTLAEAAELAGVLRTKLERRGCHPRLLDYCREEVLRNSLFHAMTEAAKSVPDRLRRHSSSGLDGADLYAEQFGSKNGPPRIRINAFETESEKAEHRGFLSLLNGVHAHFRNPRAHSTRLGSTEDQQDLLDLFSLLSYVHRRLDSAGVR